MSKPGEVSEDSDANMPRERRKLLRHLDSVLEVAFDKYSNVRTKNTERMAWGRLIVNATAAAGDILKDVDLDDLKARVLALEEVKGK